MRKLFVWIILVLSTTSTMSSQIVGDKQSSNGLWGFIDKNGNFIVPPNYYSVWWDEDSRLGYAYLDDDNLNGFIYNSKGTLLYPTRYSSAGLNENTGLIILREARYETIDDNLLRQHANIPLKEGQSTWYKDKSGIPYFVSYYYGIGDISGNILVPCIYSGIYFDDLNYNAFVVSNRTESGLLKGLIDRNGNTLVPCEYKIIIAAADNIYLVMDGNDKYGYYSNNTEIIPCIYDKASCFDNDIARVSNNGVVSLISNPLKTSNHNIDIVNTRQRPYGSNIESRYPVANSDIDNNIPQSSLKFENKFAIIIANENYEISPVPYALNDGRKFKQYCIEALGIPEENAYMYEDATYGNMISAIERIKNLSDVFNDDLDLIIYYAGHGIPDEENKSAFLLPVDGSVTDIRHTAYSLKTLYSELSKLKVNRITFFIDACFSGATREDEMLLAGRGVAIKVNEEIPQSNLIVFSASTGNETAHQLTDKTHGLFTYYLLKAIQDSKGNITLGNLSDFVIKNVKRQSVVINSKKQTPTVIPSVNIGDDWREIKL